jgi:hypothetical protein
VAGQVKGDKTDQEKAPENRGFRFRTGSILRIESFLSDTSLDFHGTEFT